MKRYVSPWLRPATAHVKLEEGPLRHHAKLEVRRIIPAGWLALPGGLVMDSAIIQGGCITTTYQHTNHDNHAPKPCLYNIHRLQSHTRPHSN